MYIINNIPAKNNVLAIKSTQNKMVNFRFASGNDLSSSFNRYRRVPIIQFFMYCA